MNLRTIRNTQGYTIDQTILIVAIIAILVTMIIITVGWNLINKSSGTKLASQFRQIEDAVGQFYSTYRVWPQASYTGTVNATNTAGALTGNTPGTGYVSQVTAIGARNFLPGFLSTTSGVSHTMGSGGSITMSALTNPFGELQGQYLVVQFGAVPLTEAQEADMAVDGGSTADFQSGRVQASPTANSCLVTAAPTAVGANTSLNVCYAANLIQ